MERIVVSPKNGLYIHVHDDYCYPPGSEGVSSILTQISTLIANAAPSYLSDSLETVG